jgi:hypothetical protein
MTLHRYFSLSLGAHGGAHAVNGTDQLLLDGRLLELGGRVQQLVGRQSVRMRVRVGVGVRLRMWKKKNQDRELDKTASETVDLRYSQG